MFILNICNYINTRPYMHDLVVYERYDKRIYSKRHNFEKLEETISTNFILCFLKLNTINK